MVFGSFSKERFPDARSHHQSSRPQIAFQEDTNTVETLINHGRGRGSLVQQGHWSSRALLALGWDGVWEGGLEGQALVLSRHCLAHGGSWALAQPVKWAHIHMGHQCPAQARPRPCLALACPPPPRQHSGLMETGFSTQRNRGPCPFSSGSIHSAGIQELGEAGEGRSHLWVWIQGCLFSFLLSPGPQSEPPGEGRQLCQPAQGSWGPRPHLSPPAPSWGPERVCYLLGATTTPSDLCWFPLSPDPAAGGPASRTQLWPHLWATSRCQHLAQTSTCGSLPKAGGIPTSQIRKLRLGLGGSSRSSRPSSRGAGGGLWPLVPPTPPPGLLSCPFPCPGLSVDFCLFADAWPAPWVPERIKPN